MPDLESIPESEVSSESVIFVFAPANLLCKENSEIGNIEEIMELFNEETIELVIDEGEDALTSFDTAMLVNVEGNVEGMQTKLYNSGASCHRLPYRDHFKNYISIMPKSITAADKQYFQAIGKGNLRIKIPNSSSTTTILLKDVLHCPDMGLTLVSIGKIASAGYKAIF